MSETVAALQQAMSDLQQQIAFQDETIDALNRALSEQQADLLVMRKQIQWLKGQLETATAPSGPSAESPPPHY